MSTSPELALDQQASFHAQHQEWLQTVPEYAQAWQKQKEKAGRQSERLSLLVKVKPDLGEGLMLGDRLGQEGVRERVAEALEQIYEGTENRNFAPFYTGVINLKGLQLAGASYSESGLNPEEPIFLSPSAQESLKKHQELVVSFQQFSEPVPRREDIEVCNFLTWECKPLSPSDVEVISTCAMVLYALSWVQEQRIKRLEYKGQSKGRRLLRGFLGITPPGSEARLVQAAELVLKRLAVLQDIQDRKRLWETLFELQIPAKKIE